jgi:hypothetical protein
MSTLRSDLSLLFANYRIPPHTLQHGLILLERVLDLEQSSGNEIVLIQDGPCHGIIHDTTCYNMVYLLVKHLDGPSDSRQQQTGHITVHEETRVYGGQTANFRNREQSRQKHIMRNSDVKVCLGHGLSSYQMDCLEVALIGFLLLMYGRKATTTRLQCTKSTVSRRKKLYLGSHTPSPTSFWKNGSPSFRTTHLCSQNSFYHTLVIAHWSTSVSGSALPT